ncbi:unnamed protein product [Didymodactylos carnosus]|uniref:Uncharacterized protein n=1 Tax=Didymodactylos carnosus TaxID=1234261 RepID=A0A816CTQ6_9BILA|nr:unnamed protein product [Didymodactylos carnosus]CAF4521468.1 unnamed protein product [Didymodactylos carnosus]
MTRYWAVNRAAADEVGGVQQKRQFSQKVMVWLSACSKAITPLVILYGNKVGNDWTFQQGGARPHIHHLTQQ